MLKENVPVNFLGNVFFAENAETLIREPALLQIGF